MIITLFTVSALISRLIHFRSVNSENECKGDKLLLQGITSLKSKIESIVEDINESLEELRFAMVDVS